MAVSSDFWRGKRVFLTGHTGFKGGWLSLLLQSMGAKVYGYSLSPPSEPNLFTLARVGRDMAAHVVGDVRDFNSISDALQAARPEIIFHLAAQSLVRYSYNHPVDTYGTNVLGTVHLLEAARSTTELRALVNVTTDKCYENREWPWSYRENEPMGGLDPYSSSKACSELITAAYRNSFLEKAGIGVATARAGNVIGGGDWAADRLLPDFLRAIDSGAQLLIRSPGAMRPWQHVLEPISGYLLLAERLHAGDAAAAGAWNFGPADEDSRSVRWIVEQLAALYPDMTWACESSQFHEANYLKLDSSKARSQLNWKPRWRLQTALAKTMSWHQAWRRGDDVRETTMSQISEYASTPQEDHSAALRVF